MVKIDEIRLILFSAVEDVAIQKGFKQKKSGQVGGLLRIGKKITDSIGWGIFDYGELKQFGGFSAHNCHNEVREITLPVLVKYGLMGRSASLKDWVYTFYPKEGLPTRLMNDFEFRDLKEIKFLKKIYRDFFINEALPYFKRWDSVLKVYEYVKDIEDDGETGLGLFPQYEKAVIMKLCNDKGYKEYFNNYFLQKEKFHLETPENKDRQVYFNAAKDMTEVLETLEPRYNL